MPMSIIRDRNKNRLDKVYEFQQKQLELQIEMTEALNELKEKINKTEPSLSLKSSVRVLTHRCDACGTKNDQEAVYCEECGVKT